MDCVLLRTVADPGCPRGGGTNVLFGKSFGENCMKIKEIGPRVRRVCSTQPLLPHPHLGSANGE